jgi:hypothetical protein
VNEVVTLKDGNQVIVSVVWGVIDSVKDLPNHGLTGAMAQYDIIMMAHDEDYKPDPAALALLDSMALCRGGKLHDDIRSVVRSAFTVDGLTVTYTDPRADSQQDNQQPGDE